MSDYDPPIHPHQDHVKWAEEILDKGVNLTVWEEEFVEGLSERFRFNGTLKSRKQEEILERIYAQRTS